jgi:hypothetical protein
MLRLLSGIVLCGLSALAAQLSIPNVAASAGSSGAADVQFAAQGGQITGVQFDIEFDPGLSITASLGSGMSTAGKSLTTADLAPGKKRFLIAGLNQNTIGDGVLVSLSIAIPASASVSQYSLHITNAGATDKDGKSILASAVDGAITLGGAARLSSAGALAQIASGGSWKTTITLVNLAPAANTIRLRFWGDDGNPLVLPFTFPQAGGPAPANSSSIDHLIGAGQMFVVETEAPDSAPTHVGWAELQSSANVAAFAVFRQRVQAGKDTEAVAFIENRAQSVYLLPYDNTVGFVTGIALTNQSASAPANITATLTDDSGNQLSVQSISLPPGGHTSFAATDRFPSLTGGRGVITFSVVPGNQIAVLGLRFNQFGSFTSIPAISR